MTDDQSRLISRASREASIDHDALQGVILDHFHAPDERHSSWWINTEEMADAVLALVRPVEGVVLSPEEASLVLGWYPGDRAIENPDERALAARLQASS